METPTNKPVIAMPDIPVDEFTQLFTKQFSAMNDEIKELRETVSDKNQLIVELKKDNSILKKLVEQDYVLLKKRVKDLCELNDSQKATIVDLEIQKSFLSETVSDQSHLITQLRAERTKKNVEVTIPTNEQNNPPKDGLEEFTKARDELVAFYEKHKGVYAVIDTKLHSKQICLNYFFKDGNFDAYLAVIMDAYGSNPVELNEKYRSIAKKMRNAKITASNLMIKHFESKGFLQHDEPLTF